MKKIGLLLVTIAFTLSLYGQKTLEKITITGKIIDAASSSPIEFATISFKKDSLVFGTTSDKKGNFSIAIPPNNYTIKAEFLSFDPYILANKNLTESLDLGTIVLFYSSEILKEVELTAQQRLTEFKIDRKIYFSSKDAINYGSNALEVLDNAPSVTIDQDGNVTMRGASATILIDGKPLFGLGNGLDLLSAMPSNNIEKIEIITRSAKYSAEGGGGILNIVTKKGKGNGLSGSIDIHGGIPENNGGSVFLNKSTDHINLFSTISFNNQKKIKHTDIDQTYFDDSSNILGFFEQNRTDENQRNSYLFNIGSDFYLNEKNTITASFLINNHNKDFLSKLDLNDFDSQKSVKRTAKRNVDDHDDIIKIETLLNYTNKISKKGERLSFDFKYSNTISDNKAKIFESVSVPNPENIQQKVTKNQHLNDYLFQLDYTLPFKEDKRLEVGYKSTLRFYKNDYNLSEFDSNSGSFTTIGGYTDIVNYDEKVHALFAQYTATHGSFSYALGLRSELSDVTIGTDSNNENSKNYTDFFPSASFGYEFENENYLSLNYSRSINRPEIYQINPFISLNDERYQSVGNPNLDPYYTNFFELLYDMSFEKLLITSSLYATYAENQFLTVLQSAGQNTNGLEIFKRTPINSGNKLSIGVDVDLTYTPFKWLRLNTYISPYREETKKALDEAYNVSNTVWYAEASALVTLNNGLRFRAQHYYQSPMIDGLAKYETINFTNLMVSVPLLKKKAYLTFKVTDVFNTKNFTTRSLEADSNTYRQVRFDQQFSLVFTYQFKQQSKNNKDRSTDINKDELEDKQDIKM
ncbi:outer membrane beta-barrel family protein [Aureibaculum sp. 2210JD6-5]|uniref:outer membrane beta-barrel family protein n=1 Tax=Aureibaculum sp. 2210JD6-5 TaxID=3103957 RepID=UPI002AAE921E|nr:outer membrane beta-barrel family protein [Aureibaculum sp. 2210JD6-5]MDY7393919.1 outer membrane beta-barrel family protein [Aureibaculum sp. 2210JD6-5]